MNNRKDNLEELERLDKETLDRIILAKIKNIIYYFELDKYVYKNTRGGRCQYVHVLRELRDYLVYYNSKYDNSLFKEILKLIPKGVKNEDSNSIINDLKNKIKQ